MKKSIFWLITLAVLISTFACLLAMDAGREIFHEGWIAEEGDSSGDGGDSPTEFA
ncbi:MAG: hypothetical protein HN337_02905 [Deltaproteobacteria bacterium]|jgi:hypothetical protein|nr:hypothetical protein [Deltaproteobacteria bacterium]